MVEEHERSDMARVDVRQQPPDDEAVAKVVNTACNGMGDVSHGGDKPNGNDGQVV